MGRILFKMDWFFFMHRQMTMVIKRGQINDDGLRLVTDDALELRYDEEDDRSYRKRSL